MPINSKEEKKHENSLIHSFHLVSAAGDIRRGRHICSRGWKWGVRGDVCNGATGVCVCLLRLSWECLKINSYTKLKSNTKKQQNTLFSFLFLTYRFSYNIVCHDGWRLWIVFMNKWNLAHHECKHITVNMKFLFKENIRSFHQPYHIFITINIQ